jgi:cell division protein FtsZ
LITTPGVIGNIDFADIRAVLENAGSALMGVGTATGDNRAVDAARAAINSPLLDVSITGAKGVLFSIAGGDDLTMFEIQDAAKLITDSVDPNAKIIFGTVHDEKLKKGEVRVTVVAAGFPSEPNKKSLFEGKIFNSVPTPQASAEPKVEMPSKNTDAPVPKGTDDDEDDWGSVPAFLRRSKLK